MQKSLFLLFNYANFCLRQYYGGLGSLCIYQWFALGWGGGATHGKFDIFTFSMSIFPPLGLHFMSNSHPWGPQTLHSTLNQMISTYKKFIQYGGRVKFPTLGTVVDVKIPTHVRFTKSNSRGLPAASPPHPRTNH